MPAMVFLTLIACAGPKGEPTPPLPSPSAAPEAPVLIPPPPTEAMVQQMIGQVVLDHPALAPYLHSESLDPKVAGNLPLALWTVPELALGAPALVVAGQPVRVVASEAEARVLLSKYERLGTAAQVRVHVAVPPEGVVGWVDVELRDYIWSAIGAEVVER